MIANKKRLCALAVCIATILLLAMGAVSCGTVEEDGLSIVTTIFAPYDFARTICGGRASIKMLLPPGSESHSYDPTPKDILAISKCDIFIYVGGVSDSWVDEILAAAGNPDMKVIKLIEHTEGLICADHGHDHADADHGHEHSEYDEHVWTSPRNAILACDAIGAALCESDPENADFYGENLAAYKAELSALDAQIRETVSTAKRKLVVFGDRFPLVYFTEAYGLEYRSAFPGCSGETEPDAATVAALIKLVKDEGITVIFHPELSTANIAGTICEATGAQKRQFHSCHNVSRDDFEKGVTYIELMRANAEALKTALN